MPQLTATPEERHHATAFPPMLQSLQTFLPHYTDIATPLTTFFERDSQKTCQHWTIMKNRPLMNSSGPFYQTCAFPFSSWPTISSWQGCQRLPSWSGSDPILWRWRNYAISILSRWVESQEISYSVAGKCLAIVWVIQTLQFYIQKTRIIVHSDQAMLRWFLAKPDSSLTRRRMSVSKFDFDVWYKKVILNSEALKLILFLPPFIKDNNNFDWRGDPHISAPTRCHPDSPWGHGRPLRQSPLDHRYSPLLVPISSNEIGLSQNEDYSCHRIRACVGDGKRVLSALSGDSIFCCYVDEFEQMVVPLPFVPSVPHLSHRAKMTRHPGGRRLY